MNNSLSIWALFVLLVFSCILAGHESINISPKLDFVDSSEDAVTKGKSAAPKIHGVRVVVDTGKLKKSIESKSVEDDDEEDDENDDDSGSDSKSMRSKGAKKSVGIRTDVTIEISDEDGSSDGGNKTRKNRKKNGNGVTVVDDDDDDDPNDKDRKVPVIKGSGTGGGAKIDGGGDGSAGPEPKWHLHNVPVFYGSNDRPSVDRWENRIPPVVPAVWTTEPNYYLHNNHNPNRNLGGIKPIQRPRANWKPCRCHQSVVPLNGWAPSTNRRGSFAQPNPFKTTSVDDKLEYPFSGSQSEEYS